MPNIDHFFHALQPIFIFAAIFAWFIALRSILLSRKAPYGFARNQHRRNFFSAIAVFMFIVLFQISGSNFLDRVVFHKISPLLSADITSISIDGSALEHPSQLIKDLRNISNPIGHHSHPTCHIVLTLGTAQNNLTLYLARDSGNPREYWVNYPSAENARTVYLGRVLTGELDHYRCVP